MNKRLCFLSLMVLTALASRLDARPAHKQALAEHFGTYLPRKLNDCRTCHLVEQPGVKLPEGEKPHNVFGERLLKVKDELRKAGKKVDLPSRIEAIADEDSDGDGVGNLLEILSGRFPGEGEDTPAKAEIEAARKTLTAFLKSRNDYRWKPFEQVSRPPVPLVKRAGWVRNPIDAFVASEHEKHGLTPRPEAARHVLLRRVYLDLIGLPPTPEQLHAFVSDNSPNAYEKIVDQLLASPHYGERWGRHWMDIWRYSDWAGYGQEVRDSQPHIWRWRDWIVDSLNADRPYDRMILEMLAGDEIAPEDPDTLRATGFLVRNWYKFNRHVWLDRTIEHTSKAFLGITMNCARCHDHFFDPITQQEYYQFRAFFEPHDIRTDPVRGGDPKKDGMVRVFDAKLDPQTFLFIRGEDKNPDKKNPLVPAVPAALGGSPLRVEAIKLPAGAVFPEKRAWFKADLVRNAEAEVVKARDALALVKNMKDKEIAQVDLDAVQARLTALKALLHVEGLEDAGTKGEPWEKAARATAQAQRRVAALDARKNVLLLEKTLMAAKPAAQAATKQKLDAARKMLAKNEEALKQPVSTTYTKRATGRALPAVSTGRRLALARWIADTKNPLTARVAVNHVWLRHFGKPLVASVFDFGKNGQQPTHPALLDWLAAEFMGLDADPQSAWSMRALHRLIVTSNAYRMDSTTDAANAAVDQDNRWLWRMNTRRMEAEIVRDSVLAASGMLDRTLGGPELDQNAGLTTRRRSLYYRYAPEKMMEFLTLFDSANVTECYQRTESVVPQQALAMANSALVLERSRQLARKLIEQQGIAAAPANAASFVRLGFSHVLGRQPTAQEQSLCESFLSQQVTLLQNPKNLTSFGSGPASTVRPSADPQVRARENLINVLMNHNEFLTIR